MHRCVLKAAAVLTIAWASALRAEQVRLYLANDDHTDYLWTANAEAYNAVFVDMLDYYLRLGDETQANPAPYRSRFNADGSYWLWQYEHRKSTAEFERLMERVKDGTISAPMTALVSCYGGQPAEAVLRGMLYAGRLERRYGVRFSLAVAMENQTLPLGLASLWAGAGARYSWRGVCGCASQLPSAILQQRSHEIYWYTGHDGGQVLMKWHSIARAGNQRPGGYAEAFDPVAAIEFLDADPEFLLRYRTPGAAEPYAIRGAFGFGWDALNRKTGQPYALNPKDYPVADHFHNIARAYSTPDRQVIVSNEEDFFRDFEARYGAKLPAETVTFGNEWELYSASMAETSARVRRAVEKLRAAELMATLVSLKEPGFLESRKTARDQAFMNLGLYWEHDWTADGPVPRTERAGWQEGLASDIENYVNTLHADAALRLGRLIESPNSDARTSRFFVLNPLGWARTDYADLPCDHNRDIHVRDLSTGRDVPHQFIELAGRVCLRVLATDVPSAGYKVFEVIDGPGLAATNAAATFVAEHRQFENARIKLIVEPDGAISSLIDKSHPAVELAATIDGLTLNDFAAGDQSGSPIVVENSGPVSVTLRCESNAGCPHTTWITLARDSERVDIRNEISENFADVRHWAFSLNLAAPDVHTEEVGAVIRAKTKAHGGNYADTHARYDYVTVNHFTDMTDGANTRGLTLANADCAFARLGRSTAARLDEVTPQLNVLAGGQVDGPKLGIPAQNGARLFLQRFGLRPHGAYDAGAAMRFGLEFSSPFVAGAISSSTNSAYPARPFSLVTVSDPNVILWALKPHEDGIDHGIVTRFWNQAAAPVRMRVAASVPLKGARRVTHLETPLEPVALTKGSLEVTVAPLKIESFALLPRLEP